MGFNNYRGHCRLDVVVSQPRQGACMTNYPLIKSMGLCIARGHLTIGAAVGGHFEHVPEWVRAEDLERALADAPIMKVFNSGDGYHVPDFIDKVTHTGRLLCISAFHQESPETLLFNEILDHWNRGLTGMSLENKIRKLLASIGESK